MAGREVAIIDSGGANIASLRFALARLGHDGVLTTDANLIRTAPLVILPGVGAAEAAMQRLRTHNLHVLIPQLRQPLLGICLGMQLLFEASEEDTASCLGILQGSARRLTPRAERPVPHMGWNRVHRVRESRLLQGVPDGAYCYFVHSYALPVGVGTTAITDYGGKFSAVVEHGNIMGTQFHPERSGATGARILQNFLACA